MAIMWQIMMVQGCGKWQWWKSIAATITSCKCRPDHAWTARDLSYHIHMTVIHEAPCIAIFRTTSISPLISHKLLHLRTSSPVLCLCLCKRLRERVHILINRALVPQKLHVRPINPDFTRIPCCLILITPQRGKAPILRHNNLLAAGELVLRAAEGFNGGGSV